MKQERKSQHLTPMERTLNDDKIHDNHQVPPRKTPQFIPEDMLDIEQLAKNLQQLKTKQRKERRKILPKIILEAQAFCQKNVTKLKLGIEDEKDIVSEVITTVLSFEYLNKKLITYEIRKEKFLTWFHSELDFRLKDEANKIYKRQKNESSLNQTIGSLETELLERIDETGTLL